MRLYFDCYSRLLYGGRKHNINEQRGKTKVRENLLQRITIDPAIMGGKPVIKGTRIPVDLLLRSLAQGATFEDILDDYPHLAKRDILAALLYGAEIISSEDILDLLPVK